MDSNFSMKTKVLSDGATNTARSGNKSGNKQVIWKDNKIRIFDHVHDDPNVIGLGPCLHEQGGQFQAMKFRKLDYDNIELLNCINEDFVEARKVKSSNPHMLFLCTYNTITCLSDHFKMSSDMVSFMHDHMLQKGNLIKPLFFGNDRAELRQMEACLVSEGFINFKVSIKKMAEIWPDSKVLVSLKTIDTLLRSSGRTFPKKYHSQDDEEVLKECLKTGIIGYYLKAKNFDESLVSTYLNNAQLQFGRLPIDQYFLDKLATHLNSLGDPIIVMEVHAGNGCLSYELRRRGIPAIATDLCQSRFALKPTTAVYLAADIDAIRELSRVQKCLKEKYQPIILCAAPGGDQETFYQKISSSLKDDPMLKCIVIATSTQYNFMEKFPETIFRCTELTDLGYRGYESPYFQHIHQFEAVISDSSHQL